MTAIVLVCGVICFLLAWVSSLVGIDDYAEGWQIAVAWTCFAGFLAGGFACLMVAAP